MCQCWIVWTVYHSSRPSNQQDNRVVSISYDGEIQLTQQWVRTNSDVRLVINPLARTSSVVLPDRPSIATSTRITS
jgi:hypothetical protein